jgi:hypothetical protein
VKPPSGGFLFGGINRKCLSALAATSLHGTYRTRAAGPTMSAHRGKSRHPVDGLTLPVLTSDIETQTENRWFRDRNILFSLLMSGTGHIAIGYPNDLPNRTSNRHPEKADRY